MDFINKQDGTSPTLIKSVPRRFQDAPYIVNRRFAAKQIFKRGFGLVGDDMAKRCFSNAGWPVKNDCANAVGFDGTAEQFTWAKDVGLAGKFVEVPWSHPIRERLVFGRLDFHFWSNFPNGFG